MTEPFETQLKDPSSAVAVDLAEPSDAMLIAFGGWAGAMGIPPFEFMNLTRSWPTKRVYARDHARSWYHKGFPGIDDGPASNAAFLRSVVGDAGVERVVLTGNSMGGYAAMLYGLLLDASEVHAFAPHTTLVTASESWFPEQADALAAVHAAYAPTYFDLREHMLAYRGRCQFHIHFSEADPYDAGYAAYVADAPGVHLHRYPVGDHNVVKDLRLTGELERILARALGIALGSGSNGRAGAPEPEPRAS